MVKNNVDKQYFDLLRHILENGKLKKDRTGTGTLSVFDYTLRFNMDEGFPLLTSKKMFMKGVIHELIWFLRGDTNIKYLVDNDVHIWDGDCYMNYLKNWDSQIKDTEGEPSNMHWMEIELDSYRPIPKDLFINMIKTDTKFAEKWGELGSVYGKQWREWSNYRQVGSDPYVCEYTKEDPIDQITNLINDLKNNPDSRRLMVSAWNVSDLSNMVLPPCHYGFQCYTEEMDHKERIKRWCDENDKSIHYGDNITEEFLDEQNFPKRKLSLKVTIRSNDVFLGNPFNIASYALLLHLLSNEVNMIPSDLILSIGDAHLYINHIVQAKFQLNQETFQLPKIQINKKSIFDITYDDIKIIGYKSSPPIKGELSN